MNYYQYQRRVPQRKKTDYIKPIIIAVIFIAILFGLWKLLGLVFGGDSSNDEELSSIQVEVESGSAEIMTANSSEWGEISTNSVKAFEAESLKTGSDGRLSLDSEGGENIRLNKNSELEISQLNESGTELWLKDGDLWVDTTKATDSNLVVTTKFLSMEVSNGARFTLNTPGDIFVIDGRVEVSIMDKNDLIKTHTVNADQQLSVNQSIVNDLSDDLEKDVLFALDEDFKKSSWYQWNAQKDGLNEDDSDVDEESEPDEDGALDEDEDEEDADEDEGEADGPDTPQINDPGNNGDEVTLDAIEQFIKGTVSSGTEAVYVNDYKLQQFKAGDTTFAYRANTDIGNLKTGKNEYEVIAEDEDGNQSKAALITLILPEDLTSEEEDEDEEGEENTEGSGGVAINAPNGGSDLNTTETSFVLSGSVPDNTNKVMVNKYQLQAFQKGNSTFSYNANTSLGTLKVGSNSYTVEAFDENGNLVGSDSMIITLTEEEAENSEPNEPENNEANLTLNITLPTTAANYETTLNQITLGGDVSASAEAVYVNNQKISYNPGSSNWDHVVDLQIGENTFNIFVEKAGQKVLLDSIKVIYNQ
jgi:hypothetical protein